MNFQEYVENKNWKDAKDEEIKAIKNNDTYDIASLLKRIKGNRCKMSVQSKEECQRRSRKIQGKISGKRLHSKSRH